MENAKFLHVGQFFLFVFVKFYAKLPTDGIVSRARKDF